MTALLCLELSWHFVDAIHLSIPMANKISNELVEWLSIEESLLQIKWKHAIPTCLVCFQRVQ